ncbi:cell division protein [Pseudomonas nicosulfuronedens]
MQGTPRTLRRWLVGWLYLIAFIHLLVSLTLTWAGHSGLLDGYLSTLERAFWPGAAPLPAREQQIWWIALFGATLQSYSIFMLALVHLGNRLRAPTAWAALCAGVMLWAPQDMLISARQEIWSHLGADLIALLVLLPPLLWLYRHDRASSFQEPAP